jgi:metal-dependent amidase/aminoacylase/carboxypeptidase family protein
LIERGIDINDIDEYAKTGFVGDIRGTGEPVETGKMIALRADMDALRM